MQTFVASAKGLFEKSPLPSRTLKSRTRSSLVRGAGRALFLVIPRSERDEESLGKE